MMLHDYAARARRCHPYLHNEYEPIWNQGKRRTNNIKPTWLDAQQPTRRRASGEWEAGDLRLNTAITL